MPYYSKEQIAEARRMDLLTYLRQYEPQELVHVTGNAYSTREHDSLKISNGKWMWWSRGIGGASALDFLVKVRGIPFTEAVGKLINEEAATPSFSLPKEEFSLTKTRFGKHGGIVAIHGYQSFEEENLSPEEAHVIGVQLARELWGDRFQVIVATHLNTGHVHNHFVINSVSYKDGKRFHMCTDRYLELKDASDRLCREHQLSVIEHPSGKDRNYRLHQMEKAGMPTRYSVARAAIDAAISRSVNMEEFKHEMKMLGYCIPDSC